MVTGQEICDNGIDDDQDGLIDLNDDECMCDLLTPSSLIPNPSFEERNCCPNMNAQLNCADGWIQASAPTTDYINTCSDYLGNTSIPAFAPLPMPDGEGVVGFRDGQANVGPSYKEYVGSCLTASMIPGVEYKLQFYVGFRDVPANQQNLDIAIFGSTSCNNLPFGGNSVSVGCPANTSFYDQLGVQSVSGSNEWILIEFNFTAASTYEVIVIGPSCANNSDYIFNPYFYLDGLTLAESAEFGTPLENETGSICNDDLVLSIEGRTGAFYQWYKDGIALIGQTNRTLELTNQPDAEGRYNVVMNFDDGCIESASFNLRIPPYYGSFESTICEGDSLIVEDIVLQETGTYTDTITAVDGCDSILTVDLLVTPTTFGEVSGSFCEGETFAGFGIEESTPGTYETSLINVIGCDSILTIFLEEIPQPPIFDLEEEIIVELGSLVDLIPTGLDPSLNTFEWTNIRDQVISDESAILGLSLSNSDTYTLTASDATGCSVSESVSLRVDKSNRTIHLPNVFSPNEDGINDLFRIESNQSLSLINRWMIYDRWGNLMYSKPNNSNGINEGWDGLIKNIDAAQGVYTYLIDATFIDGHRETFAGSITLLR